MDSKRSLRAKIKRLEIELRIAQKSKYDRSPDQVARDIENATQQRWFQTLRSRTDLIDMLLRYDNNTDAASVVQQAKVIEAFTTGKDEASV